MNIINFVQVSEDLASSGQPTEADFKKIAKLGYTAIINLALSTSDNAIPNEGDIVTELGMTYIHIPVQWQNPMLEQFEVFATIMRQLSGKKIWLHCALNMRVSAFLYLYSTLYQNLPKNVASQKLSEVWQPNEVWSEFISNIQNSHNK